MKQYERIISIIMLAVISLSNVATPAAYAAQKLVVNYPVAQKSKGLAFASAPHFRMNQGSVLGASTSLLTVGTQQLDLSDGNSDSAQKRVPPRMERLAKKAYQSDEDVTIAVVNPDNEPFSTTVVDDKGNAVSVPITEKNTGMTTTVDLAPTDQVKPGKYTVSIADQGGQSAQQDFTWGVLAINFDKSEYHPGETGDIGFAVLNDNGDMVCDSRLELKITNSALGIHDDLTSTLPASSPNAIIVNPQCQTHDYSLQPDYEAHYKFRGAGTYTMQLTGGTDSGMHTITDSIHVTNQIPFDVQRISATRIYPPNTYPMTFNITANRDFTGTVSETVPDSFTITPATMSATPVTSYTNMQTVYLDSNDPSVQMQQAISASASGGLVMPFHGSYPITQGFGAQLTDPTLQAFYTHYGLAGHDGIDFGLPMDTPLYAVDAGTVIWSGPGDYGTMVTIQHSWGETYYGHMSTTSVGVGTYVSKGQLIGYSGMSGEATGPHLHFGMKPLKPDITNGYFGKVDPMQFLPIGQGEPVTALGPSSNPVANAVYNMTVLGASDSAVTPTPTTGSVSSTPTDAPSQTPSPTPADQSTATQAPTVSPTLSPIATPSATPDVSATPSLTPVPSVFSAPTTVDNTSFSVLQKQILLDEQIANNSLTEKVKIITWHVSLKKGESTSLGYDFQAPHVSPQFYLLGPAHFYDSHGKDIFQEQRQWEIASDDVGVEWYSNTTGSPMNGYSWQYRKKIDISSSEVNASASAYPTVDFMDSGGDATEDTTSELAFWNHAIDTAQCSVDTSMSETGPASLQATTTGSNTGCELEDIGILADSGRRVSEYVNFAGFDSTTDDVLDVINSGTGQRELTVCVTSGGVLEAGIGTNCSTQIGSSGQTLSANTWYRITFSYVVTSTTNYSFKVYVNGVQSISYSQTSGGTTLNISGGTALGVGWDDNTGAGLTMHMDDVYVDSGSDESDPGDVHVTAKRPNANGASVGFGTQIGSGGSGYGTGHSPQVNERPLNTANGWSTTSNTTTEEYSIEGQSTGDVNIPTNAGLLADQAWIYINSSTTCTTGSAAIINNGVSTNITLPGVTKTMFTNIANINSYPSGNKAVGISSCTTGGPTISLYEAGAQVAYIPDLINFPVLVNLSSDTDLKNKAQSTGNDIVFTDSTGETLLPFEIESYASGTGSLQAWVDISSLSTNTDTIIYMYYGNPSTSSKANATGTWNSNFVAVYHMAGSSQSMTDSTSDGYTGTGANLTAASGEIDGAQTLDGATSKIDIGDKTNLDFGTGSFSIYAWLNEVAGQGGSFPGIFWKGGASSSEQGYDLEDDGGNWNFHVADGNSNDYIHASNTVTAGSMENVAYVVNRTSNTTIIPYLNGTAGTSSSSASLENVSSTHATAIGYDQGANSFFWQGTIDEVEISNTSLSAGWIKTEYNNQSSPSSFEALGSVETAIYAPTLSELLGHGDWFNQEGARQPFVF